jgi:hypothetical protein
LTVVDVFTRESLAIEVGQRLKGEDVVRVLSRISSQREVPKTLFCVTSQAMDLWAYHAGVRIDFSRPGKPTDNVYVESFNGTLRMECLDAHWFWFASLTEQEIIEAWPREYNESRPHRAHGERTPHEIACEFAAGREFTSTQLPETHSRDDAEKGDRSATENIPEIRYGLKKLKDDTIPARIDGHFANQALFLLQVHFVCKYECLAGNHGSS